MRFGFILSLAILALGVLPSFAQTDAGGGGTMLGGFYCPTKLACNGADPSFPQPQQLIDMASRCVSKNSTTIATPIFDALSGLDDNGCLTSNPDAFPISTGGHVIPHCCIIQAPSGGCAFYCTNIAQ